MKMIALYLRLSHADIDLGENNKDESNSIENQRKLLQDFVENNDELNGEIAEYVDDGFTGTNFDRPGFLRMIEDAKKGKIGTIIVKDLSRLGRDYIGVGDYLEQIFPSMGIRVIAINSNYDSENFVGNTLGMDVSITNLVNSLYSKDLSKKVRSGKIAKWKNGGTTGERQPFGYVRDPMQQKTWNIDPEAAKIVKLIFEKANEGWGTHQITDLLNELELPTPSKFYQQKYGVKFIHVKVDDKENIWDTTKVWRILRCYSYTGNVIHGKRSRIIVGNSTARKVAEKDQILVKNVLPPIITEEEFDKAQFVIKKQGTDKKGNDLGYPLTFRVKCGNCKLSMSYKTKNGLCLTCRHATVSGDKTTCQKVDYPADVIENQVYQTIKKQMSLLFELGEEIAEKSEETKIQSTEKVKTVDARIKELQEEKVRQYESYANGNLKRDLFVEAKMKIDEELNSLFTIQKDEENKTSEIDELLYDIKDYTDVGMELMKKEKLTRNIAIRYIDTVYVYDIDRIEVNLKFQTVLDRALTAAEQMK